MKGSGKASRITPLAKAELLTLINSNASTNEIKTTLADKHQISISDSSISKMRNRLSLSAITHTGKDLEKVLRKKRNISHDLLDSMEIGIKLIKANLERMGNDLESKDFVAISQVVLSMVRLYTEIEGNKPTKDIDYNIQREASQNPH